jgi:hypothetical protein
MQKQAASKYTHETVPTQFAEADGARYAFRRFGKAGTVPLLFHGYFNSNMDAWDPEVTNALAADQEVILFDNAVEIVRLRSGAGPHAFLRGEEDQCTVPLD